MSRDDGSSEEGLLGFGYTARHAFLFGTLVATLTVPSFLPPGFFRFYVVPVFVTLVLLMALATLSDEGRSLKIGLVFVVPILLSAWIGAVWESVPLQTASEIATIVFMVFLGFKLLQDVFRKPEVDTGSIFAALAVYMIMAYVFALAYSIIDLHQPDAFSFSDRLLESQAANPATGHSVFSYFSIITLTTLGYGDISPVSVPARSTAMLEAVLGQLYLVTMVARLVGLHVARGWSRGPSS